MKRSKIYTPNDLIEKILELDAMTSDRNSWNEKALEANPPRLIRLRQINSLIKAFFYQQKDASYEINNDPNSTYRLVTAEDLLSGEFLQVSEIEKYAEVSGLMRRYVEVNGGRILFSTDLEIFDLLFAYRRLISFKQQIRDLLTFNRTLLEAGSISGWFTVLLTKSIADNLIGKYAELDEVLSLLISPERKTFSEKELISKFGYPTDDLLEIDIEYF